MASADHIATLARSHEKRLADHLNQAITVYIDGLNESQIASCLNDTDAAHIRRQLALILDLSAAGIPIAIETAIANLTDDLGSFATAVAAHAAARYGHTVNTGAAQFGQARSVTNRAANHFAAATAAAIAAAIEYAIYATGPHIDRARQLVRSIGLTAKQADTLEHMQDALQRYLAIPPMLVPSRIDAVGKPTRPEYLRSADPAKILAPTRGHITAAQRQALVKAIGNPRLTASQATEMLDLHAKAIRSFRIRAFVGDTVHQLAELGKLIGWQLAQTAGRLPADQRKFWTTAGDERVRHSHAQVPQMNPDGVLLESDFDTPLGKFAFPPLEWGCRCQAVLG